MSSRIILSGPMGNGIRPKKYFETTKELMRKNKIKSVTASTTEIKKMSSEMLKTA
jgi:hypothetical protein